MALAHLHNKVGKVGYAASHSDYIQRIGKYKNSIKNREVVEAIGYGNMPLWAVHDPSVFWQSSDAFERKNGTSYREIEASLPRELTPDQRKDLVEDFIKNELGLNHAYTYAIHCPEALDKKDQPHFHLQFSERINDHVARDPAQYFKRYNSTNIDRGGCKKGYGPRAGETLKASERKEELQALRKRWEDICNRHLELAGSNARIDMRSYKDRGISLQSEQHQGAKKWAEVKKSPNTKSWFEDKRVLHKAIIAVRAEIQNPMAEIIQLQAARDVCQRKAELAAQKASEDAELQRQIEKEQAEAEAARQEAIAARETKDRLVLETVQQFPDAPKMWAMELGKKGITSLDLEAAKEAYSGLFITKRDIQNTHIYIERNRNWNNANHALNLARQREKDALEELNAAKVASQEHKGFLAWAGYDPKGEKLKLVWEEKQQQYSISQTDTVIKSEALDAAKKLLDAVQQDAVKSIKSIRTEQFTTAQKELVLIEERVAKMQERREQAQEWTKTGRITLTDKQKADWQDFADYEKQVICLYELNRACGRELLFINFSTDTSNSWQIPIHPEQIHDVLEGKEPRVLKYSIKNALDKMAPSEKVQVIREAVIEIVKRHAAPLVDKNSPAYQLMLQQQLKIMATLEQDRPVKQKERDNLFKPKGM